MARNAFYSNTLTLLGISRRFYDARSEAESYASYCAEKGLEPHELQALGYKAAAEVSIGEITVAEGALTRSG